MKILIVSHFIPYPPHGGSPQRNFNLFREAAKENSIHFLTFTQRQLIPDEEKLRQASEQMRQFCDYVKVIKISSDYSRLRWYLLLFLNLLSFKPYSAWRFRSTQMKIEIESRVRSEKYDLIHVDTIALAEYVRYAGQTPSILNHHNIESTLLLRRASNEKNPLVKFYLLFQGKKLRRFESKWIRKFTLNVTVSELDKQELMALSPGIRAEVVPNGTDIDYFKPSTVLHISRDKPSCSLIYTGGMTWYPNRDAMTYFCRQILPLIKNQIPEIELAVIGRNPPRELVEMADGDGSIKLLGYVEDVRPHINRAAVYVVPIRVGGGTRLKILDAMACGKAIVSTSIGCEGLDVSPGINILVGDTPEDFAASVVSLLRNSEMRRDLERNARRLAEEKYSWARIGMIQNSIHRELAK
jgi:glycosyltransferase involved in cell wall biosynthesis